MLNGDIVKMVRLTKRMTQAEFGKMLGVSQSTIALIESGRRTISETMRVRLLQEVDFDEFIPFFEQYKEMDSMILV